MNETILELGEAYLDALKRKDLAKIMFLAHPDIHFRMPMTEVNNREGFMMAIRRTLANLRDLQILSKFSAGNQAMFLYEVHFNEPVGVVKAASLMTVAEDKIHDIEVIFDARPFEKVYGTTTPSELKKAA